MLKDSKPFSGFSTNDLAATKVFYGETLGLDISEASMGMLNLKLDDDSFLIIYPKEDHTPASYTILNFPVSNIDQVVDELASKGIVFEQYDGMTDDKGVARGIAANRGPDIAWFKDPAGNILSVLQSA